MGDDERIGRGRRQPWRRVVLALRSAIVGVGRFLAELVADLGFELLWRAVLGLFRAVFMVISHAVFAVLDS